MIYQLSYFCVSTTMLSSTFELFNQANSINSFVAFIFCNLIIVILLVNNSSSNNKIVPLSKTSVKNNCSVLDKNNGLTHTIETTTSIKLAARDNDNHDDDDNQRSDDEKEEEEDDELTRKVEQFIQKVNRCWKAEKLRA